MFKKLFKTFFVVNKHSSEQLSQTSAIEICKTSVFSNLITRSENFTGSKFHDIISNEDQAFEIYRKIVPYTILSRNSLSKFVFVVQSNYLNKLRTLEFVAIDSSGIYRQFVDLEYLTPATWDEYCKQLPWNVPWSDEINHLMIFKHAKQNDYYFFPKYCEWNQENVNHPDFDFRTLFKENEWLEDTIQVK